MSNIIDSIQLSGVTYQIQGSGGGGVPESTFTAYTATTDERISQDEEVTAAGLNALNDKITPTVELTQAQYDALVTAGTVAQDTYYIITDATAVDMANYYTTAQTNSLLSGKQNTLVSGTNIKTVNNESILGSGNIDIQGGSTYTAGRGISIANDTISFSLPISAGTGTNSIIEGNTSNKATGSQSHAEGYSTTASGSFSHTEGNSTTARGNYSHAEGVSTNAYGLASHSEGFGTIANNQSEYASGQCNISNKATNTFGDSGNTLFSVGNGTDGNARHNAFEIRQNGDIYLSSGGTDIKLQDHLGGSSITVDNALDDSSENPVQNKVLYDELRIVEVSDLVLEWENNDGGHTTNYPIGTSTLKFYVDESQMTEGYFTLISNIEQDSEGFIYIQSNNGTVTVADSSNVTYSISGNVVTVTIDASVVEIVDEISSSYDNYWTVKAVNKTVTPLIDKVGEIEEVAAAALNELNDKIGDIETLLSQI